MYKFAVAAVLLLVTSTFAGNRGAVTTNCVYWQSKVDPDLPLQGSLDELPADRDATSAVQCLLLVRGRTGHGRFGGATRVDVSQIAKPASVGVAALYYITFIYAKTWYHADAVMLVGPDGMNTRATETEAFDAFEHWFRTIRHIGIAEARVRGLHPLLGTPIRWSGSSAP